jgi:predicted RecB family nuclease
LKLLGESGTKSEYEAMITAASDASRNATLAMLAVGCGDQHCCPGLKVTPATLKRGEALLVDALVEDDFLSIRFDALKRADGASRAGNHHYLPVLHRHGDNANRLLKLLLAVLGLGLESIQGLKPSLGLVAAAPDTRLRKVRLDGKLYKEAELALADLKQIQQHGEPPQLMLNRHCLRCEYRQRCRAAAIDKDHLSLLGDIGEKELRRYNRKGIFTLTQLSCTFRPRKKGKRVKHAGTTRYPALHALAIREKKVHVYATPALPRKPVGFYFDAEGVEGARFTYLLGVLVADANGERMHSFWADGADQEEQLFDAFLDLVEGHPDFCLFHYGRYERVLLMRMRKIVKRRELLDRVIERFVNVLSAVHAHVYFPTYSNGLNDVGRYLGSNWTAEDASGLQSLVWRARWEETGDSVWKDTLVAYNAEDCAALRKVTECVQAFGDAAGARAVKGSCASSSLQVAWADEVGSLSNRREFCHIEFSLPDFDHVNQCAFFDYQREKVFLRTSKAVRKACAIRRKRRARLRANREVEIRDDVCPYCQAADITRLPEKAWPKSALDLEFGQRGIRSRVIRCTVFWHWCEDCQKTFHLLPLRSCLRLSSGVCQE